MANTRLSVEEQSLNSASDVLDRIRTLALQGSNGTQTDESRKSIAAEMRQNLQQLVANKHLCPVALEQWSSFSVNEWRHTVALLCGGDMRFSLARARSPPVETPRGNMGSAFHLLA